MDSKRYYGYLAKHYIYYKIIISEQFPKNATLMF